MGSLDLITEVTLKDGTTVRTTTYHYDNDDFFVAIDTPSTEQAYTPQGYSSTDMQALVHRAVVRALIEEDKRG